MANTRITQAIVDVVLVRLHAFSDRRVHIDFEEHIHAAAQVEPEAHWIQAQVAHPVGQFRRQGERDIGFAIEARTQALSRLLLVFDRLEADEIVMPSISASCTAGAEP